MDVHTSSHPASRSLRSVETSPHPSTPTSRRRPLHRLPLRRLAAVVCGLAASTLFSGCGAYTLKGRVVSGAYSGVMLVPPDDSRLSGPGLANVRVAVVRDATRLNREQVASATSDPDGGLTLEVRAAGAGITDEEWLIAASRSGLRRVESMVRLPLSPDSVRLLIVMAGAPRDSGGRQEDDVPFRSTTDEIMRDVERYGW